MRFRGGHNLRVAGKPSGTVDRLPGVGRLFLPLASERFAFTEVAVDDGAHVVAGQAVARDPQNHGVPLIAPRCGTIHVGPREIVLDVEDGSADNSTPRDPQAGPRHVGSASSPPEAVREKLLGMGAWQFFRDAHTGVLPDPFEAPRAVIVDTLALEPFLPRGNVLIEEWFDGFTRGLEHLQSLLEYQSIHLVMPEIQSALAKRIRDAVRGHAWIKIVGIPLRYPAGNAALICRRLGLKSQGEGPVWAVGVRGVLAVDQALTDSLPAVDRIITLGGPAAASPRHLHLPVGYPLEQILDGVWPAQDVRVLNGGLLGGVLVPEEQRGVDCECRALTLLPDSPEREFLGFMRPGADRQSYSRSFLSALRPPFAERVSTLLRGERRPCVACGSCEKVCPAGIMPHLIHKALYADALDEVETLRADLCVRCGLCSYVCPSKIELRQQIIDAVEAVRNESVAAEQDST